MFEHFDDLSLKCLSFASEECWRVNYTVLAFDFVFLGILRLEEGDAYRVLTNAGLTLAVARTKIQELLLLEVTNFALPDDGLPESFVSSLKFSHAMKHVIKTAASDPERQITNGVKPHHLLLAFLNLRSGILLETLGLDRDKLTKALSEIND